jgi:putative FmdB family regulatory protein
MPIYSYRCRQCGHRFEMLRGMNEKDSELVCPKCGTRAPEKVIMPFFSNNSRGGGGAFKIG